MSAVGNAKLTIVQVQKENGWGVSSKVPFFN